LEGSIIQTSTTMTPAQQREFENAMKNTFGEKFFVSLMEQSGMSLPQEPGAQWRIVDTPHQLRAGLCPLSLTCGARCNRAKWSD
jgi:hypothetical protein